MKKISRQGAQLSWLEIVSLGAAKGFGGLGLGLLGARYLKPKQQQQVGAAVLGLGFVASFFMLRGLSCGLSKALNKKEA
jgi:hypothetical protein